ncbi:MAG: hypothetical protein ACRDTC_20525 [Pseudonocardiaceae bacterium]
MQFQRIAGVRGPGWADTLSQTGIGPLRATISAVIAKPTNAPILGPKIANGRSVSGANSAIR